MIPQYYYFMVDEGNDANAPHVGIPARRNAIYIFENRKDVDEFIKGLKYFRDIAFGEMVV